MIGGGHLAIFKLGLRHRGLEVDVPQRRRLDLIGEATLEQAEKGELRHALRPLPDRGVGQRPVDREPEIRPQLLERLFVLG